MALFNDFTHSGTFGSPDGRYIVHACHDGQEAFKRRKLAHGIMSPPGNRKAKGDIQKQTSSSKTNYDEFADDEIDSSL